jgi:predicted nucleic acid-binding protein
LTRVFFDANVIIAASASNSGAAHVITRLADQREDFTLLTTEYAWDEAERNLQQQMPEVLPKFYDLKSRIGIVAEPSEGLVNHLASYIPRNKRPPNKDLPIIAGAIFAAADYLITHDGEHFEPLYGERIYDVEIQRPATVLARLQPPTRDDS